MSLSRQEVYFLGDDYFHKAEDGATEADEPTSFFT